MNKVLDAEFQEMSPERIPLRMSTPPHKLYESSKAFPALRIRDPRKLFVNKPPELRIDNPDLPFIQIRPFQFPVYENCRVDHLQDWELSAREADPPRHDIDATDGQKLTLGDTTITIYITPGHTAGTLSVLVPVKDHGVPHLAMEWGGTALSGNTSREMLLSYISNAGRFLDIVDGSGADVIIGNHTEYNDALARFARTKARKPGEPNPWVVGKAEVRNYLTVVQECAKSWLAIGDGRL